MSESETRKTIGVDGLIEFGDYPNTLSERQDYTFSMPDEKGRLKSCSLEDVIRRYQEFFNGKGNTFRVWIGYNDYQSNIIGSRDMVFNRNKPT